MRELVIKCDMCGEVIKENPYVLANEERLNGALIRVEDYDICDCCIKKIANVIEGRCEIREKPMMNLYGAGGDRPEVLTPEEVEEVLKPETKHETEPTPDAKVVKTSKPKPVDLGKIMALRAAGWTAKAIGEEMGMTEKAVYNQIYKHNKKGGARK